MNNTDKPICANCGHRYSAHDLDEPKGAGCTHGYYDRDCEPCYCPAYRPRTEDAPYDERVFDECGGVRLDLIKPRTEDAEVGKELRDCPFCGHGAERRDELTKGVEGVVACVECGAANFASQWNTRTATRNEELVIVLKELVEAVKHIGKETHETWTLKLCNAALAAAEKVIGINDANVEITPANRRTEG